MTKNRVLRLCVCVGLSLSACTGPRGPAGPGGDAGPAGLPGAPGPAGPPGVLPDAAATDATSGDGPVGKAPSVTIAGATQTAGFGALVTLTGTAVDPDSAPATLTFKWVQKGGPTAVLTGGATNTMTFTTRTLADAKASVLAQLHFGVLPIHADEAGNYSMELSVTDAEGNVGKATATIRSTPPTTGLQSVPIGIRQYLMGDGDPQKTWGWTLDASGAPSSTAVLSDTTSQLPSFVPDVPGSYLLTETVSKKTLTIVAGNWRGAATDYPSQCQTCHNGTLAPDNFTLWSKTPHARALQSKLNGLETDGKTPVTYFPRSCIECHAVGDSPAAVNNGFDDIASASGWTMPTKLQIGNWETMVSTYPSLARMANIQCENCHGPQGAAVNLMSPAHTSHSKTGTERWTRVSMSAGVCASCHQSETHHYKPSQWAASKHASRELVVHGTFEGRGTSTNNCGRCHAAQGFVAYAAQLAKGDSGVLRKPDGSAADEAYYRQLGMQASTAEAITCAACHDPHDASKPKQLRIVGDIKSLPNGQSNIVGAGTGAVCMACHNTRNGEHDDFVAAPTSFSGPHMPAQTDVLYGFNAYFMPRLNPSKHLTVADTCAGCHVALPTATQKAAGRTDNHNFAADSSVCANCHSAATDGEAFMAANATMLEDLGKAIGKKAQASITALYTAGNTLTVRAWKEATDQYSVASASAVNVVVPDAPTAVVMRAAIHGQTSFTLTLATPVEVTWVASAAAPALTETVSKLECQISSITVTGQTLPPVPPATTGAPVPALAADSVVAKASWNMQLLSNDGTKGLHNPSFFQDVVANTLTALK